MESKFLKVDKVIVNEDISEFKKDIYELLNRVKSRVYVISILRTVFTMIAAGWTVYLYVKYANDLDTPAVLMIIFGLLWCVALCMFIIPYPYELFNIGFNGYTSSIYTDAIFAHRRELNDIRPLSDNEWLSKFLSIKEVPNFIYTKDIWQAILDDNESHLLYDTKHERIVISSEDKTSISVDVSGISIINNITKDKVSVILYFDKIELIDDSYKSDVPVSVVWNTTDK